MFLVLVSELIYFYSLFIISDDLIITAQGPVSLILKPIFGQMEHTFRRLYGLHLFCTEPFRKGSSWLFTTDTWDGIW